MIFSRLFGRKPENLSAPLYAAIVAAARQEIFFAQWQVPDTLDGRFDVLAIHMFLVLNRLRDMGAEAEPLAQQLTDHFFAEMDAALREVGVGDLSVGKKVRKMAEAFYGRATAYRAGLEKEGDALAEAVRRNVFAEADASHAPQLAQFMRNANHLLAQQSLANMLKGEVRFS